MLGGYEVGGPGCWQFARWSDWPPATLPDTSLAGIDNSILMQLGKQVLAPLMTPENQMDSFIEH